MSLWPETSPKISSVFTKRLIFASFFDRFCSTKFQRSQIELFDRMSHAMAWSRSTPLSYEPPKLSNSKEVGALADQKSASTTLKTTHARSVKTQRPDKQLNMVKKINLQLKTVRLFITISRSGQNFNAFFHFNCFA